MEFKTLFNVIKFELLYFDEIYNRKLFSSSRNLLILSFSCILFILIWPFFKVNYNLERLWHLELPQHDMALESTELYILYTVHTRRTLQYCAHISIQLAKINTDRYHKWIVYTYLFLQGYLLLSCRMNSGGESEGRGSIHHGLPLMTRAQAIPTPPQSRLVYLVPCVVLWTELCQPTNGDELAVLPSVLFVRIVSWQWTAGGRTSFG